LTDVEIAPFVEAIRAIARALDRFQELLRNDRIGIDIRSVERGNKPGMNNKLFHLLFLASVFDFLARFLHVFADALHRIATGECKRSESCEDEG
jgi:hypothetical protein